MSNESYLDKKKTAILEAYKQKAIAVLTKAGLIVEGETKKKFKEQTQYGTGTTAASIISIVEETETGIICKVGSNSKVFTFREKGTSPHKSNVGSQEFVESVTRWGKRQGLTDEEIDSVIFFIRIHGTKPRPSLMPAFYENKGKIQDMIKKELL